MSFKIVPWLLVLSITLAYAFPAEQSSDENDPNHVHDDNCTHPIKEAYNKAKASMSNAYQKTKESVRNAFNKVKNVFNKSDSEKSGATPSSQGNEGSDSTGVDNTGIDNAAGFPADVNGPINTSGVIRENPSQTSNVPNASGQQIPTDSQVESLIDVRFQNKNKRN